MMLSGDIYIYICQTCVDPKNDGFAAKSLGLYKSLNQYHIISCNMVPTCSHSDFMCSLRVACSNDGKLEGIMLWETKKEVDCILSVRMWL